jgi:hypothetical protein
MHTPRLSVVVRLLAPAKGGRVAAPFADGRYRPHLRVGPDGEYLGVVFVGGGELPLGSECAATIELVYEGVDYTALRPGVEFSVLEGARVVGSGVVRG